MSGGRPRYRAAETALPSTLWLELLSSAHHHNWHCRRGRSLFRFDGHRECLGLYSGGQWGIDHRRAPMSIGFEHSGGNRRSARRDEPEFVGVLADWGRPQKSDCGAARATIRYATFAVDKRENQSSPRLYGTGSSIFSLLRLLLPPATFLSILKSSSRRSPARSNEEFTPRER